MGDRVDDGSDIIEGRLNAVPTGHSILKVVADLILAKLEQESPGPSNQDHAPITHPAIPVSNGITARRMSNADRLAWLENVLAAVGGRGGGDRATPSHDLPQLKREYSGQLKEVYSALGSIQRDISDMRQNAVRLQQGTLGSAFVSYVEYKYSWDVAALKSARQKSREALTSSPFLDENLLGGRLCVATEYVLHVEEGGDVPAAKKRLVRSTLPFIIETLPFWRPIHADKASYNQVMLLLLELVSSVYLLPPFDEDMIPDMCTSSRNGNMEEFVGSLARFCGRNPVLASEFADVTVKIIKMVCSGYDMEGLRGLARQAGINVRDTRESIIHHLSTTERPLDFDFNPAPPSHAVSDSNLANINTNTPVIAAARLPIADLRGNLGEPNLQNIVPAAQKQEQQEDPHQPVVRGSFLTAFVRTMCACPRRGSPPGNVNPPSR